ncbi:hypothetical protein [Shouchella shacheensis]|uniref:hypothetical protein n=1 Tax=Shouchella shacheensis TaxID=1649580 RepID=UPI0007402616|nr:hypothetical protein [Shouchella shacheensis]
MVFIFRVLLLGAMIVLVYSLFKYMVHPKRKLAKAQEKKQFYFLDDAKNVRKNFQLTYKGVLFEGEKYLEATSEAFEIVRIYIGVNPEDLQGFKHEDFRFLEEEVRLRYPDANIEWKAPIRAFMRQTRQEETAPAPLKE